MNMWLFMLQSNKSDIKVENAKGLKFVYSVNFYFFSVVFDTLFIKNTNGDFHNVKKLWQIPR